ncbi:MAG: glucosidase [Acidobacteriota bacterium]
MTAEHRRLDEARRRKAHWKRWGPYLSERSWGTVREDYSPQGTAWEYFPHDHARSRAYRWGEDGLAGISDRHQLICLALALWNGRDPILKERLFGLTGNEGNCGEDVKEYYFYLDSTPTHSYMKYLYKYSQQAYPYRELVEESRRRRRGEFEFELLDTGIFDGDRYFDVFVEYAKASPEDILMRISVFNRGPEAVPLHVLPTLWFRNTWSWDGNTAKPFLERSDLPDGYIGVKCVHPYYGTRYLYCGGMSDSSGSHLARPQLLFTENETNVQRLFGVSHSSPYTKDGIHEAIVHGRIEATNRLSQGSKAAAHYSLTLAPFGSATLDLRFRPGPPEAGALGDGFNDIFSLRRSEADEFYAALGCRRLCDESQSVIRQAFAGLLWSKQFFHLDLKRWLNGDPAMPEPPPQRKLGRNRDWQHLYNADVISMPDKWEYPWYAAWDLAFHCLPLAVVDPDFAKEQLVLLLREWYMHPNGQIPAYEWAFGDVNPPVHAWAAWRVYKIDRKMSGRADLAFLERVFHKLLLNFTWWVNRKDAEDNNVFQGGFLGLDNIGVFDRSRELPTGGHLEQSDGTSWMGMYCLNMLAIAMELARHDRAYADVASKFFEHFVYIAGAMHNLGGEGIELWDKEDGFYYDVLHLPSGSLLPIKLRSMVGLIPIFAVETLDPETVNRLPSFKRRMQWFIDNRAELGENITVQSAPAGQRRMLSIVNPRRLQRVLRFMLDENEFLSPYGIRALSRHHKDHPYTLNLNGNQHRVDYEPAESRTGLFGGNSNWRGPVWFPVNFLIIESLQKYHYFLGDSFQVEFPTGSGQTLNLWQVATQLSQRLIRIFMRDSTGRRPLYGGTRKFQEDPYWRDLILFHEYFHGDNGAGLGASHQTGWTGLVAKLLLQSGE